jgi:hypothetical protein
MWWEQCVALAQLILHATFYKSTKRQIAERKDKAGQVDLSDLVVDGEDTKNVGSAS